MTTQDHLTLIDTLLDSLVSPQQSLHCSLYDAARYALLSGGKRLRPLICLMTAEALGCDSSWALHPSCALEMVHCYSMIHDDLPCMDDDDYRRGQPTVHKAFPESHAVLAGDFLLTYAFEVLSNAPHLTAEQRLSLIRHMSEAAGGEGMIGGQILDIEAENKTIDLATLQTLHKKKTAALITCAFSFGGIIANAEASVLSVLQSAGNAIGLAFQIADDVLDVTQSEEKHGRSIGSDELNGKTTYVSLLGLARSQQAVQSLLKSALETLEGLPHNTTALQDLCTQALSRAGDPPKVALLP